MAGIGSNLDPEIVGQILEVGGEELLRELFETFCGLAPERLRRMHGALADGDRAELGRAAHSIRSSAASVGARSLAALAREIERQAEGAEMAAIALRAADLEALLRRVLGEMRMRSAARPGP
jgi:HPt (histidine-containing phosphotransfer) domain-containing protein